MSTDIEICKHYGLNPDGFKLDGENKSITITQENIEKVKQIIMLNYTRRSNIKGDINEHLPTLMKYAEECDSIIELGVRGVVSTWAFMVGLMNKIENISTSTKSLYMNDITPCNIQEVSLLGSLVGINMNGVWINDLNINLTDMMFDMTFIDTWHVYGQLKRELNKYAPHTKKYIIMHDTTVDEWEGETIRCRMNVVQQSKESGIPVEEINKGLWPAIDEFLKENKDEWELHMRYWNNNGLTILKRIYSKGSIDEDISHELLKDIPIYDMRDILKSYKGGEDILFESVVFTNDKDVIIKVPEHEFTEKYKIRDSYEVSFRKICTYLIENKIIKNNIIDLGAWIGDNSMPWSKNINGYVYAIDPSPENCNFIKETCILNNIENIKIIQSAISNKVEKLSTNDNINHCSFVYGNPGLTGKTKISSITLDQLYKNKVIENVDFIHLDVEGMEFKVIEGGIKLIKDYRPIITYEQHFGLDRLDIIIKFLNNLNYNCYIIDEIMIGCRQDCRNYLAFPNEINHASLIINLNKYIGKNIIKSINLK
jgi:FkbM family methyltransferase